MRHLVWDTGAGLTPKTASTTAPVHLVAFVVATIAFWAWLFASQHVVLSGKALAVQLSHTDKGGSRGLGSAQHGVGRLDHGAGLARCRWSR